MKDLEGIPDRIFEVEVVTTRTVRVRVPDDPAILMSGSAEEAAEEFALGGRGSWPEWVITEDEETEVESIREINPPLAAAPAEAPPLPTAEEGPGCKPPTSS